MKTAQQYIIDSLSKVVEDIPSIRVRYEYDEIALIHFIEVVPQPIYKQNSQYVEWENKFYQEFIENFPLENLCFISQGDAVQIENPIFTKEGDNYNLNYSQYSINENVERAIDIQVENPLMEICSTIVNIIPTFTNETAYESADDDSKVLYINDYAIAA